MAEQQIHSRGQISSISDWIYIFYLYVALFTCLFSAALEHPVFFMFNIFSENCKANHGSNRITTWANSHGSISGNSRNSKSSQHGSELYVGFNISDPLFLQDIKLSKKGLATAYFILQTEKTYTLQKHSITAIIPQISQTKTISKTTTTLMVMSMCMG